MEPIHVQIPYPMLKDYLGMLRNRRYDLEIYFPGLVLDQIEKQDIEKQIERLDWNPKITLHAPFMDLNPGAMDPMVRSATQVRFRQFLAVAAILKPRAVVFHGAYDRWRYSGRKDIWLENSIDTWQKVMDTATKIGLRVAVENVFDEEPDALQMLIEKIDSPDFGFCFDIGHFNLFSSLTMEQWFESLGRHLVEVHLHDNDGKADSHRALGQGNIDFEHFFRLMNTHAPLPVLTVEVHDKDGVETSLEQVKRLMKSDG
jgi:sugar phosphate isomerase/epimerase